MGKKSKRDSSVEAKLEGILELIGWQQRLTEAALKQLDEQAGLGSGRRGSQPKSKRRT